MGGPVNQLDRGTGSDPTTGTAGHTRATAQRGIPPPEPIYVFRIEITDTIRTVGRKERHLLCWEAVFGVTRDRFWSEFDALFRSGKLEGLGDTLPAGEYLIKYKLNKSHYTLYNFPGKRTPDEIRGTRDAASALLLETQLIGVLGEYARFIETADTLRKDLAKAWLADILKRLGKDELPTGYETFQLFSLSSEIIDKLALIDEQALHGLMDTSDFGHRDVMRREYSVRNALRVLSTLNWRLDEQLKVTSARATAQTAAGSSLKQAITQLLPLQKAYAVYERLESLESPTLAITLLIENDSIDLADEVLNALDSDLKGVPYESLLEQELRAELNARLQEASLTGPDSIAELERRIYAYRINLRNTLLQLANTYLGELLTRIQYTINKANADNPGYLEALFQGLKRIEAMGKGFDAQAVQQDADLLALENRYPILEFSGFRDVVIGYQKKFRNESGKPAERAARSMRSDLIRTWKPRTKRTIDLLRNRDKIWLADKFRIGVLEGMGIPKSSFLHAIAAKEQARVESEKSIRTLLFTILSIALTLVPGGGFLALATRLLAVGIDFKLALDDTDALAEASALYRLNLTSDEPSPWVAVLSLAGAGLGLDDVAKVMRLDTSDLFRVGADVVIDPAIAAKVPTRREMYRNYLDLRKQALKKQFAEASGNIYSKVSVNPIGNVVDIAEAASVAVRLGITKVDEYVNEFIMMLGKGRHAPVKELRAAHDAAMARLAQDTAPFSVDELQQAVHALHKDQLPRQLAEKRAEIERLIREDHDLLDQGQKLQAKAKLRARRELEKEAGALRRRIGRAREVLLKAKRHRQLLSHQSEAHAELRQAALGPKMGNPKPTDLAGRTDPGARRIEAYRQEQAALREFLDPLDRGSLNNLMNSLATRKKAIDEQIRAIELMQRGLPLDLQARAGLHEAAVAAFLRDGDQIVGIQVRLEVTLSDGRIVEIVPDCVVLKPNGRFHIADAKWSDSQWVETGNSFLQKLGNSMTDNQSLAFPEIQAGVARDIRFADPAGANQFGLSTEAALQWDNRVDLYLNQKGGGLRTTPVRPSE